MKTEYAYDRFAQKFCKRHAAIFLGVCERTVTNMEARGDLKRLDRRGAWYLRSELVRLRESTGARDGA